MITECFDLPILDWIAEHLWCPFLDAAMPGITFLGNGGWFWILLAVILLCLHSQRKTGIAMGIALVMGLLICNLLLKPLVGRIRPFDYQLQHFGKTIALLIAAPHDFSFPSGHTIASVEAAAVLCLHRRAYAIPACILAALIAFSRLYLYVHYPTDVLASLALGIGIAFAANFFVNKGNPLIHKK